MSITDQKMFPIYARNDIDQSLEDTLDDGLYKFILRLKSKPNRRANVEKLVEQGMRSGYRMALWDCVDLLLGEDESVARVLIDRLLFLGLMDQGEIDAIKKDIEIEREAVS